MEIYLILIYKSKFFLLLSFIVGSCQIFLRLTIRDFVNFSNKLSNKEKLKVAIYGAGENGAQLVKNLRGLVLIKLFVFLMITQNFGENYFWSFNKNQKKLTLSKKKLIKYLLLCHA